MQNNERNDLNILCTVEEEMIRIYCMLHRIIKSTSSLYRKCPIDVLEESQMREDGRRWEIKMGTFSSCFVKDEGFLFDFIDDDTPIAEK
jgi:hypothetical protein